MITAPAMAARPEMRGVARVGELITALTTKRVSSLTALCTQWESSPGYLRAEVAAWLPRAQHSRLAEVWPRLVTGALTQQRAAHAAAAEAAAKQERRALKRAAAALEAAAGGEGDADEADEVAAGGQGVHTGGSGVKPRAGAHASKAQKVQGKDSRGKQQQQSNKGGAPVQKKRALAGSGAAAAPMPKKQAGGQVKRWR